MNWTLTLQKKYAALFALVGLYVFSSFFRISVAVIAPQLTREFDIGPEALGLLGGVFFYAFALCQFPLGPMLDRVGPRIVITACAVIGGAGSLLFALSPTYNAALCGRILLGMGMAAMMMGTLKVFAVTLPPGRFSRWVGILVSIGMIGSVMAASPFAYAAQLVGWRATLSALGIATLLFGLAVFKWLVVPSAHTAPGPDHNANTRITTRQSFRLILGSLSFWQLSSASFCRYGTFVSIQGVWLALYLVDVAGFSMLEAGHMLLILAIAMGMGSPCGGWLYDRMPRHKKQLVLLGLGMYAMALVPFLGLVNAERHIWYGFFCFVLGFASGFGVLSYSYSKDLFPESLSGSSMAWVNFFVMLGGAVFMQIMGRVIESWPKVGSHYPPEAYHVAFTVCFLVMIASTVFFSFIKPIPERTERSVI